MICDCARYQTSEPRRRASPGAGMRKPIERVDPSLSNRVRAVPGPKGLPRLSHPCNPCNLWTYVFARANDLHHRRLTRYRPRDRDARRRRRRQRRHLRQDHRAASEAAGHDLHARPQDVEAGRRHRRSRSRLDIRDEAQVEAAIAAAVERFGGIDILVNNASAISLTGTLETPMKRFDLMHQINMRGTFLCTQKAAAAPREVVEPARPQHLAAAAFDAQPALVRAARRLHDGEVRHVAVRARHGGGVSAARHRRQRAVAAHDDRHRGDPVDRRARRRAEERAVRRSWPTPRTGSSRSQAARSPAASSWTMKCCGARA